MSSEKKVVSRGKKIFWVILSIVMIGLLTWQLTTGLERIKESGEKVEIEKAKLKITQKNLQEAQERYNTAIQNQEKSWEEVEKAAQEYNELLNK